LHCRAQAELLETIEQLKRETKASQDSSVAAELRAHSLLEELCVLIGLQGDGTSPEHAALVQEAD
jgi:hypothetical protein